MKKDSVTIIGSAGVPANYGGFETLAEQLCIYLPKEINIIVYCSSRFYNKNESKKYSENTKRVFINLRPNGVSSILYDIVSFIHGTRYAKTHLILGGSSGIFLPLLKIFFPQHTIIFNPDGIEWKRKKWNSITKLYLKLCITSACNVADKIIIDNQALLPYYTKWSKKTKCIAYGGDQYINSSSENHRTNDEYWLTIARAEPENNLSLIASFFSDHKKNNWYLISNFKSTAFGRKFYAKFNSYKNINLINACYDNSKIIGYLNNCLGYIHGHSSGGTNPTLTSAMWIKKPIICHDNIFNRTTTKEKAIYFNDINSLAQSITQAKNLTTREIDALYTIAYREYKWTKISSEYYTTLFNNAITKS